MLSLFSAFVKELRGVSKRRLSNMTATSLETMESRVLPSAAAIVFDDRVGESVLPGAEGIVLSSFHVDGNPKATGLRFDALPGTDTETALDAVFLLADNVPIATDNNPADGVSFPVTPKGMRALKRADAIYVVGNVSDEANDGDLIGLGFQGATLKNARRSVAIIDGEEPVYTVQSPIVVQPAGNLLVTQAGGDFGFQYILAGGMDKPVQAITLTAIGGDVSIQNMVLSVFGNQTSLQSLALFHVGDTSPFATATPLGPSQSDYLLYNLETDLSVGDFVVHPGTPETVLIAPVTYNATGSAVNGDLFFVDILADIDSVHAVDPHTGTAFTTSDEDGVLEPGEIAYGTDDGGAMDDILGNPNTVVFSELKSATNVDPNPQFSTIPVGIAPVVQMKLEAEDNNNQTNLVGDKFTFTFIVSNVLIDTSGFRLYNKSDASTKISATLVTEVAPGAFVIEFDDVADTLVDTRIPSGEDRTFVLEANFVDTKVDNTKASMVWGSFSLSDFGYHWKSGLELYVGIDDPDHTTILGNTYLN